MKSPPLNRQGVRNLDLGRNARPGPRAKAPCLHDWEHDRECTCAWSASIVYDGRCSDRCRRCGEVR